MIIEQNCGSCKWWIKIISDNPLDADEGNCIHPVPDSFKGAIRLQMHATYGKTCPTWEVR